MTTKEARKGPLATAELTEQSAFDIVCDHLNKQPKQAFIPELSVCSYEINGLKCAVGALMDEKTLKHYGSARAGVFCLFDNMASAGFKSENGLEELDLPFLERIQDVHDNPRNWDKEGFKGHQVLIDCATDYGLNTERVYP